MHGCMLSQTANIWFLRLTFVARLHKPVCAQAKEVRDMMHGTVIDGRAIVVRLRTEKGQRDDRGPRDGGRGPPVRGEIEEHKLYVAGLTPTVQENALRDIFGRYGCYAKVSRSVVAMQHSGNALCGKSSSAAVQVATYRCMVSRQHRCQVLGLLGLHQYCTNHTLLRFQTECRPQNGALNALHAVCVVQVR